MALSDYAKYKKITIDSSKIDSNLSHFPLPIPLGASVGLTNKDVTDIFNEVGNDYLKIAVFQDDEETQLYVEVEYFDATDEKGLLWVSRNAWDVLADSDVDIYLAFDADASDNTTYVGSTGNRTEVWNSDYLLVCHLGSLDFDFEFTADDTHDIGSNQEGIDGASTYGSPTDNGDYYTFDGSGDGLYFNSDYGDETAISVKAKFRVHNKDSGSHQCIWKSGGEINGMGVGLDGSGNLGMFGISDSSVTSLIIDAADVPENTWLEALFTTTNVVLSNSSTSAVLATAIGTVTPGDGNAEESIGFSYDQSPFTGTNSTGDFFDGDIDWIEIGTVEKTFIESSSNQYEIIVHGDFSLIDGYVPGGKALVFGDYDYLEIDSLFTMPAQATLQVFHAQNSGQNTYSTVFEQRSSSTVGGKFASLRYDVWGWWNGNGVSYDTGGSAKHLVAVKDNTDAELFMDNVSQGTYGSLDTTTPDFAATIGARTKDTGDIDPNSHFDGGIDELRVYDGVMSSALRKAEYYGQSDSLLTFSATMLNTIPIGAFETIDSLEGGFALNITKSIGAFETVDSLLGVGYTPWSHKVNGISYQNYKSFFKEAVHKSAINAFNNVNV